MAVLSDSEIAALTKLDPPLIRGYADWDAQLQPAGFDCTLDTLFAISGKGEINLEHEGHRNVEKQELAPEDGVFDLAAGYYIALLNELVHLPKDIAAFLHTRSTLMRYGATVVGGVWDPGFTGRSQCGVHVANPSGLRIKKGAIIAQMTFHRLESASSGFQFNHLHHGEGGEMKVI